MATAPLSTKYMIEVRIEVDGIVDRNDVIGATFGQTEGIFSSELDLRELQKTGRIGRIDVVLQSQGNKTLGRIIVPSSMDKFHTALVAAMIESLDRVGPYNAKVTIEKIEDMRAEKRKKIVERARTILYEWEKKKIPEEDELLRELEETVTRAHVIEIGPEKIPAGPDFLSSDEVIVVEGRADIISLMRYGYKNVIAVGGVKIPYSIQDLLAKKKKITVFLDGDKGGDMVLRGLSQVIRIDSVARAPYGKEVEDLNAKEIEDALRDAVPLEEALKRVKKHQIQATEVSELSGLETISKYVGELEGTLMSVALDKDLNELWRKPVSELAQQMSESRDYRYVIVDGVITQRLIDIAASNSDEVYLIGARIGENLSQRPNVKLLTMEKVRGG